MTKAKSIIANAKKKIVSFIGFETVLLYTKFGWDMPNNLEEEDYHIPMDELSHDVYVNVEVDNSYLDLEDRCYEDRKVTDIFVNVNEVTIRLEGDIEISDKNASIEELAAIADALEATYKG